MMETKLMLNKIHRIIHLRVKLDLIKVIDKF